MGAQWDELVSSPRFEEYQSWQSRPIFRDVDYVVSMIGNAPGRARFRGVYRVLGSKLVEFDDLPKNVPWYWKEDRAHYLYELECIPGFSPLEDTLVVAWTNAIRWDQHLKDNEILECPTLHDIDIPSWSPLYEGKAFSRLVTSRQRSREAREKCLGIHGCRCSACGMTFPEQYAGLGEGFMHVHHKTEIASKSGEYEVDPDKDLSPVCPNCHAMLHWNTDTPRTIEQLRTILDK
ncbi:HNH endonuclease [Aeoliella sp. SH292]|uniref:HNH endonuclease n=1 Tax=Aeoliella sp. SH292 TaxID=3454464 RepID=UPI003F95A114